MFKLFRMKRFVMLENFVPQDEHLTEEKEMQEMLPSEREDSHDDNASAVVMLWIDKKEAYRVYDRFDESELQILEDGNFLVHLDYKMDDWGIWNDFVFWCVGKSISTRICKAGDKAADR